MKPLPRIPLLGLLCLLVTAVASAGEYQPGVLRQLEQTLTHQGSVAWVNDVVVSLMADARDDAARQRWLDDYDVDLFDWYCGAGMNAGNFYRLRGIRTSCAEEYEYEESLQFDTADTFRLFERNGLGLDLHGNRLPMGGPYKGAYYMEVVAPKWREVVRQGLLRPAAYGDCVTQDNIGTVIDHTFGWDTWNEQAFKQWLGERCTPAQLRALGVGDLQAFEPRKKLLELRTALRDEELLENPLARQWILFQNVVNLKVWGEMVRDTRAEALRRGRPCPAVYGNQCRDEVGLSPYQVAQSALVDVVWIETGMFQPGFTPSASARSTLTYKVGWASGRYAKPVWNIEYPGEFGNPGGEAAKIVMAEAQANGGLCYVGFGPGQEAYQKFFGTQRALFTRRQQYARVGLVYSIPSLMWRSYGSFRMPWDGRRYFNALGRVLEDRHVPYEVVVFGHPELWDDNAILQRLSRYDSLLLPSVDCLTAAQVKALQRFAAAGGTVVTVGPTALRDESYRPVPAALKPTLKLDEAALQAYLKQKPGSPEAPEVLALEEAVCRGARGELLRTSAPRTVWTTPWLHEGGRLLAVHLVNYDFEPKGDRVPPVENVSLEVKLPASGRFGRAVWVAPEQAARDLPLTRNGDWAKVTVPRLDVYGIVVFTSGEELERANTVARARRALDRILVATAAPAPAALAAQVKQAATLPAARAALAAAEQQLQAVIDANLKAVADRRAANLRACGAAVRAFDFGGGQAAAGCTQVTTASAYGPAAGFGWERADGLSQSAADSPDALHGDAISGVGESRFRIDLPNGDYSVTVVSTMPAPGAYLATTSVQANGDWKLLGERGWAGVHTARSFPVSVREGTLLLTFSGTARNNDQGRQTQVARDWAVCGVVVRPRAAVPPAGPNLSAGALRDWLIAGPFACPDCRALEQAGPPPGAKVEWKRFTSPSAALAPVRLAALISPLTEQVAYGRTQVYSDRARQARLWLGTTGLAVARLNGREVARDLTAAGLQADELSVPVRLERGWNPLQVQIANYWGDKWAFAAALTAPDGTALPGLRCAATGAAADPSLPRLYEYRAPVLRTGAAALELGKPAAVTVEFTNGGASPLAGELALMVPPAAREALRVEGETAFAALAPAASLARTFTVTLLRPLAEREVTLTAEAKLPGLTRTGSPVTLPLRQPSLQLSCPRLGFLEPATRPLFDFRQGPGDWTGSLDTTVSVGAAPAAAAEPAGAEPVLHAEVRSPGDGKPDNRTIRTTFAQEPNDWSLYDTLSYWVRVTDDDATVATRNFCVVVMDRAGRGGQQYAMHTIPVNRWVQVREDLSGYYRDDVATIIPHLYLRDYNKSEHYHFYFRGFTLQRTGETPLARFLGSSAAPQEVPLIVRLSNPLSAPLTGTLQVAPPAGWSARPGRQPVAAAPGRTAEAYFTLAPPAGAGGVKVPLEVTLSTEGFSQTLQQEVSPLRTALCPVATPAPESDVRSWPAPGLLSGFSLLDGSGPARAQTTGAVACDDTCLYIAARCTEPQMPALRTRVTEAGGPVWEDDCMEVYLQPAPGTSAYYHLIANAAGVLREEGIGLPSWRSGAVCRARRDGDGWSVYLAVPFSALGGKPAPGSVWGLNLNRGRPAKPGAPEEYSCWSCTYGGFHNPARFGLLLFR